MPRTRAASPVPSVTSSTERLGSRHAEEDPRSDRAFAPRWSGSLTAVPCANTAVRPRDTPGSGKSRSVAETRPRHPDRTAPRHTKPPVRGTESLRLQTAVVFSSRPLARWRADPRDTYPNTSCLRLFSDRSRPPFAFGECGTFRTLVATSPQVAMVGSQERGGWLNDEHSATRWIGSGHGDQTL